MRNDVSLTYVRSAGRALRFDAETGVIERIAITPEIAQAGCTLVIGIRVTEASGRVQHYRIERKLDLDVVGAAQLAADGWRPLDPGLPMAARDGRDMAYRLFLPRTVKERRVALMEGPIFARWVGTNSAPFGRLAGLGAALVIREQPYNCVGQLVKIASAVTDGGIITRAVRDVSASVLKIELAKPLTPAPEHHVIWWAPSSHFETERFGRTEIVINQDSACWCIPLPSADREVHGFAAISFRGQWIGTGWTEDPADLLAEFRNMPSPLVLAALTRWCRLPVLIRNRPQEAPVISEFAREHAAEYLTAWLTSRGLPEFLHATDSFERREQEAAALRELFLPWVPDTHHVERIVRLLGEHNPNYPFEETVRMLAETLPLLTGHLMLRWFKEIKPLSRGSAKGYVDQLRHFAGIQPVRSDGEKDPLELTASTMRVDPRSNADAYFVKHAIVDPVIRALHGEALTRQQTNDLLAALQIGSVRQYLATRIFDEVAASL
jgi:hypothetical protein